MAEEKKSYAWAYILGIVGFVGVVVIITLAILLAN